MNFVRIPYEDLRTADLTIDAVYEGGRKGNAGDDPLGPLLGVSNQGGFRHRGGTRAQPHLLVLTTSLSEPDWPDNLDAETGLFTYYGDNRAPGQELHATRRWGNQMLRDLFERSHSAPSRRLEVPPVFVFMSTGTYRDVRFLGLAVPGATGIPSTQDLVAIWRHSQGQRFQNYRAIFSILDCLTVKREWIADIHSGRTFTPNAPLRWVAWVNGAQPTALKSLPTISYRERSHQLPTAPEDVQILEVICSRFKDDPFGFEACAAQIAEMLLAPGVVAMEVTRPSRDGGRDAIGKFRIGFDVTAIDVDFALEAKCYAPSTAVGVRETSRLISRLRHRQFGILITTSYLHYQAFKEVREDQHPILIVSGGDIVEILKRAGLRDSTAVTSWLSALSSPSPTPI